MDDIEWNALMDNAIEAVAKKKKEVCTTKLHTHTRDYCLRILDDLTAHFEKQKIEGYEEEEYKRDWKGDII